ncbi:MAG TPA: CapA family protein, partial [Catenuloplanes sp.]
QLARHAIPVDANREGVMARLTFTRSADGRWRTSRAEAIATWVELRPDVRLVDVAARLADPGPLTVVQRLTYRAALERVRGHVLSRGADRSGLVVATPPR